jgi:hypothetical protein
LRRNPGPSNHLRATSGLLLLALFSRPIPFQELVGIDFFFNRDAARQEIQNGNREEEDRPKDQPKVAAEEFDASDFIHGHNVNVQKEVGKGRNRFAMK